MNNMSKSNDIIYIKKEFDNNLNFASSIMDIKGFFYKNSNFEIDNIKKDKKFKIIKLSGTIYP